MILSNVLFAFLLSIFLGSIFAFFLRIRGPWNKVWSFAFVLFLAIWAAGVWFTGVGPQVINVSWVPMVFVGILVALILAAMTPNYREEIPPRPFGIYFYVFILSLLVVILLGMMQKM
ncbi:MAG TPA: hypothetical protein VE870_15690 [Bacteroidales bacterium]|nr:hypothetical protein [Bacteroidales bacterium]